MVAFVLQVFVHLQGLDDEVKCLFFLPQFAPWVQTLCLLSSVMKAVTT